MGVAGTAAVRRLRAAEWAFGDRQQPRAWRGQGISPTPMTHVRAAASWPAADHDGLSPYIMVQLLPLCLQAQHSPGTQHPPAGPGRRGQVGWWMYVCPAGSVWSLHRCICKDQIMLISTQGPQVVAQSLSASLLSGDGRSQVSSVSFPPPPSLPQGDDRGHSVGLPSCLFHYANQFGSLSPFPPSHQGRWPRPRRLSQSPRLPSAAHGCTWRHMAPYLQVSL